MVYFGPVEDIKVEGSKAYGLKQISVYEKYEINKQHAGFFYNDDKECAKKYGLDKDKQYVVMFNGNNTAPYIQEVPKEGLDPVKLLNETFVRSAIRIASWGHQA